MTSLSIFTISRNNLKDLQLFILKMISGAQGGQYSEKDILEMIDFIKTILPII